MVAAILFQEPVVLSVLISALCKLYSVIDVSVARSFYSVPARLGKGQGVKEIGHNLAHERPKFGHNLVRKRHNIGHSFTRERPTFGFVGD